MWDQYRDPYREPLQPAHLPQSRMIGDLELITAPSGAVVTTQEARDWLRVAHAADDAAIAALVERATDFCEKQVRGIRQLRTATFEVPVLCWWEGELRLPRPPLQSVAAVRYYDTAGTERTLPTSVYEVRAPWKAPGTVERKPGQSWPALEADRHWPVRIRFTAGYASADQVPGPAKQAILFLVTQWYEQRMPIGQVTKEVTNTVCDLLLSEEWGSYA